MAAFGGRDEVLVLALGNNVRLEDLGPLPDDVIACPHVPQRQVLERTALFITHGGMGSVMEGLTCGVPLLLYPQGADQFLTTKQAVALGVGRKLGARDLSPKRLRTLATTVMNDGAMQKRIGEIAQVLGDLLGSRGQEERRGPAMPRITAPQLVEKLDNDTSPPRVAELEERVLDLPSATRLPSIPEVAHVD